MRYYCHTHFPLGKHVRPWMQGIANIPGLGEDVRHVTAGHPTLDGQGIKLGDYATFFALAEELAAEDPATADEMIGFSSYRKFASATPVPGAAVDIYNAITPQEFIDLRDEQLVPPEGTLVVPAMMRYGISILDQYAHCHMTRDFLYFIAIAIDLEVIDGRVAANFLSGEKMLACPTVGFVPKWWFVQTMRDLGSVYRLFSDSVSIEHEGYQARTPGFCLERLHALLLMRLVSEWSPTHVRSNRLLVVSDDRTYSPGA